MGSELKSCLRQIFTQVCEAGKRVNPVLVLRVWLPTRRAAYARAKELMQGRPAGVQDDDGPHRD